MAGDASGKIMVAQPEAGEIRQVAVRPGMTYQLGFYPDSADFALQDADVRVSFEDGAILALTGFFSISGDFLLELPDGTTLSGKDVADALSMDLKDFHTNGDIPPDLDSADSALAVPLLDGGGELMAAASLDGIADLGDLLAPAETPAALCHSACAMPGVFGGHGDPFFILPGAPQEESFPPQAADAAAASGAAPPAAQGEVLQLEDLLDTSGQPASVNAPDTSSMFESLFMLSPGAESGQSGDSAAFAFSHSGEQGEADADQWVLAFLQMGSG